MKILQLCHRVPFPANDGGNIAMISMADGLLAHGVYLKMLTLNTKKHQVNMDALPARIKNKYSLESVFADTSVHAWNAFKNFFSSESYNVNRFHSTDFENKLTECLSSESFDTVLMESLFMTLYIPVIRKISSAKIILRAHNVEHRIWERLAANEKKFFKRNYLLFLARRLKNYELQTLNKVDALLPITADDEKVFAALGCRVPMLSTPVGIDGMEYPDQLNPQKELSLFHLGAMDWRPNLEGVEWFLDDCWGLIHKTFPSLKLFLAGRGFPQRIIDRKDERVECAGEIMNAQEFMKDKQMMIVPLKSGGGMRVKIIQGLALGKTIISTTIGAEGINYTDGKNILIADTPEDMLQQIQRCLLNPAFCFSVGREARQFALQNYSNSEIGKMVLDFIEKI
jgi:glycosyltransferase involved in cell wall biosynthesis